MGREFDIPWVGSSKYHGYRVQYTMDRGFDIPWIGIKYTMDRGFDIPWIEGSIYHG
jgi:hypothetical protein